MAYAAVADVPAAGAMFHANHLLFTPLIWGVLRAFRLCGYAGPSMLAAAAVSAALTAGAAAFFYLALRRLGAAIAAAAVATAAAALSAGWWFYAGEAEVVAPITFFLAGGLFILASASPGRRRAVAAACWLGAGTCFHLTIALFVPIAAIVLTRPAQGRWPRLATFGAVYAAVAAGPYVIISQLVYRHAGVAGFWHWITFYERTYEAWGVLGRSMFVDGLIRALCTVVSPGVEHYWGVVGMSPGLAAARLSPAVLFLGCALATTAAAGPRLWREKRVWLLAGAVWFVGYQLFFSWWDCGNGEWWVATVMPLWFLFGLAAPRRLGFVIPAAAVVLAVAAVNYHRLVGPAACPGRDANESTARVLLKTTRAGDTVWVANCDVAIWLINLSRNTRNVVETDAAFSPEWYYDRAASLATPAAGTRADGGATYLLDAELDNRHFGRDAKAKAAREALFKAARSAEAVTVVPFDGRLATVLRCRGSGNAFGDLRIYEAEGEGDGEYAVLWDKLKPVSFEVDVPRDGRYVLCVQARGESAAGAWPVMQISTAGRWLAFVPAHTNFWRFYEVTAEFTAGTHRIDVYFCNPFEDPATGRGRLLFVNRLAVYRAPPGKAGRKPHRRRVAPTLPLD